MSRGDRRRTGRNLSSRNTRTGSRALLLTQRVQRSLKSLLLKTSTRDTRSKNESNAHITTNDHSSNPWQQVRDPAEKLTSSNPHLADDMKEAEGNNVMIPQQQEEFLVTDGDDEEKCTKEQKALSHLG